MVRQLRLIVLLAVAVAGCSAGQSTTQASTSTTSSGPSMAALAYQRAKGECRYLHQTTRWTLEHAVRVVKGESMTSVSTAVADGCAAGW